MGKLKIGLALGSGAARGLSHIGVIRALEENDINVNVLAGTSIGSVASGMYAAGMSVEQMTAFAREFGKKRISYWIDPSFFRRGGLLKGNKIEQALEDLMGPITFQDLKIPLYIVASDLLTGKEVVLSEGDVIRAIRASFAIPGVFAPVKYNGMWLIDGATVAPVPTRILHQKKCDVIIAVNVTNSSESDATFSLDKEPKIIDVLMQALVASQQKMAEPCMRLAQVNIVPELGDYDWTNFSRSDELIEVGYNSTMEQMPRIKRIVSRKKRFFFFRHPFQS
jgi:NTE family protein